MRRVRREFRKKGVKYVVRVQEEEGRRWSRRTESESGSRSERKLYWFE